MLWKDRGTLSDHGVVPGEGIVVSEVISRILLVY